VSSSNRPLIQRRTLDRFSPEMMAYFRAQQELWRAGRVRLEDYFDDELGAWYAQPLASKVIHDKASFFASVGYRPSLPACMFHGSTAKVRVFSGGARAGKSLAAAMELCPILMSPGTNTWLVGPEYDQCVKEFSYVLAHTVEHPVVGPMLKPFVERVSNKPHQGDMAIEMNWGDAGRGFLRVKSSQRMTSLLSEELDAVCVVEAAEVKELAWKRYLMPRLITRQGIAIFPSSPSGMGWLAELYRKGRDDEPGFFSVNADTRMNPTVNLSEVEFFGRDMTDEDFAEQIEGRPMPKHGLVYPTFTREIHVDTWRTTWPEKSWRRGRAIDFGYTDPFVVLWIAEDEDRRLYVYREFYRRKMLMADVVREIAKVEGWETESTGTGGAGIRLAGEPTRDPIHGATYADWAASGRAELRAMGISTRKADKDILGGIRTVAGMLRVRGDGRPRLHISPACSNLIREFGVYQWDRRAEKPKEGHDDHALDALRYYAHTTQPAGRAAVTVRVLDF